MFFDEGTDEVGFEYSTISRKIMKPKYLIVILIVTLIFITGCGIVENDTRNSGEVKKDYITVASFNIQIFG
ncbi:hypothetical protein ES705_09608 [subsurface metagenome]